jgi:effector-binding domain-containing protein
MTRRKKIITASVIVLITIGLASWGPIMSNVEKPDYIVTLTKKNIEIREYSPMITASVRVSGERKEAIRKGFRLVADYIFGNNAINTKIAMTAPVQQRDSQKIAMTAPVQQQRDGQSWEISFVMPKEHSIDTLPNPKNSEVTLSEVASKKFVVIKFSGRNTDSNIEDYTNQLEKFAADNSIQTIGSPKYAFYNPPWTLPLLRRNEVMLELAPSSD